MSPSRTLVLLAALRWFPTGLVVPVLVLLLTARGLSLAQVGQMIAVYSVVTLLLELPTGGLADTWGRRPVVVGSALVQALALTLLGLVGSLPVILVAVALLGAARALSSGPLEAWYVDTSHAAGEHDIESGLAHGQMAEALALGAGAVLGGILPSLVRLPDSGDGVIALSAPFLAAAAMGLVFAAVAWSLLADEVRQAHSVGRTVAAAVVLATRNPGIRRLILIAVFLGVVLSGVELIAPDRVADLVGSSTRAAAVFGVLTASAFVVSAGGAWLSTRLPGRRGWVGAWAYLVVAVMVLGLAAPWLGVAAVSYLAVYLCIGVQGPVTAALLHARIDAGVRSTMMSVESLALQAGGAMASLTVGWLVTHTGLLSGLAFLAAAALSAFGLLVRDVAHRT